MNKQRILEKLNKLLEINSLEQYSEQEALNVLQDLIEHSYALGITTGTQKAIDLSETINILEKFSNDLFLYHYFMGIAWGDLKKKKHKTPQNWYWEQIELENEVTNYRLALIHFKEETHDVSRYLQICANLGNSFDNMGRFISAMEAWKKALDKHEKFGMAMALRGNSSIYHGYVTLFDGGHKSIYIVKGCQFLKESLQYALEQDARCDYEKKIKYYEENYPQVFTINSHLNPVQYSSEADEAYRNWAYTNTLFLNPLNDIEIPDAQYDPLLLPTMIIGRDEAAGYYHSFFNQIKQEYISARYFLYEGITSKLDHFSDEGAVKYDMYDYSLNSLQVENVKSAYRMAYSIFDKISFFLNYYMKLDIPEKSVKFRTLWFDKNKNLRTEFEQRQNLMFRGLYWLSKDLYYNKDENFVSSIEPDAQELANIRNHIEHKSFRIIHERFIKDLHIIPEPLKDNLSFSIGEKHFHRKTIKVLKMAREAIMYLSYGVNHEERIKDRPGGFIPGIELQQKY